MRFAQELKTVLQVFDAFGRYDGIEAGSGPWQRSAEIRSDKVVSQSSLRVICQIGAPSVETCVSQDNR